MAKAKSSFNTEKGVLKILRRAGGGGGWLNLKINDVL